MNINACSINPCPILLSSKCVIYEGSNLVYTGISTNDSIQTALVKIDAVMQNALAYDGTVTLFSFTNTSEISGIVTNPTTIPNLSLTLLVINGGTY